MAYQSLVCFNCQMIKFSIIVLCYNESKNLEFLIKQGNRLVKNQSLEIIFVDNGSKDETKFILKKKISKSKNIKTIFIKKNIGYGYGVICGLNKAKGDVIGWTHGDDLNFYKKINTVINKKIFTKNIFLKGYRNGYRPLIDFFFSYGFNILSSIILRKVLWEITAYPTLFSKKLFIKYKKYLPYDFSIDLYLFYLAKKENYHIKRVNFFYNKRKFGESSWNKNFFSRINLSINYIYRIFRLLYLEIFKF